MSRRDALIYGRRACLAAAEKRPEDILRVLYQEGAPNRDLAPLLKACAKLRRPYRAVSEDELRRASGSAHHEGVLLVTRPRRGINLQDALQERSRSSTDRLPIWVALDRVQNDHNHGAIARTLAWFGGEALLWQGRRAQLSGAALRIAQGGAEHVDLITVHSLVDGLTLLKSQGITILGADQNGRSLSERTTDVTRTTGVCWVMGSEQYGLSKEVKRCCDELLSIPGANVVESLNVSVSAGILISQSHQWLHS